MAKLLKYTHCMLLLFCCLFSNVHAQSVVFGLGTGGQGGEWLRYEIEGAIGYSVVNDALCVLGGVKVQNLPIVSPSELRGSEDDYIGQTTDLWNFAIYGGLRYSVNAFKIKRESDNYLGFFPECRLYFSPSLPREITFEKDNYPEPNATVELKSERMSQWAYGVGGGFYYGDLKEAYIALKFETSNIDIFKSLHSLDYKNEVFKSGQKQYIVSLSFYTKI